MLQFSKSGSHFEAAVLSQQLPHITRGLYCITWRFWFFGMGLLHCNDMAQIIAASVYSGLPAGNE